MQSREKDSYGYLAAYRQGYYRIRYGIGYTNKNPRLIQEFMRDAKNVFGLRPRYQASAWRVVVKSKIVWELMKRFGAGRSREWFISKEILEVERGVQAAWIKAFFDDEAHFVPKGGIRVRSVNRPGLEQLAKMVRQFVPCHVTPRTGLYPDETCYLAVLAADRPTFLRLIGSTKFSP
jgi:hypothetical protein